MHNEERITELDKVGMRKAMREEFEIRLGLKPKHKGMSIATALESLDDLMEREEQRVKDGFHKKIKFRRILVGQGKVIVIPYVEEDQFRHGDFEPKRIVEITSSTNLIQASAEDDDDITVAPGSGDGEVGDVIGQTPLPMGGDGDGDDDADGDGDDDGDGGDPGSEPGDHALEEGAYEIGRRLTEQLELPNLTDKKKRFPTDEYTYDLTDRHHGSGQLLDKKETLKEITKTNLILGRIDKDNPDPSKMIVTPKDYVYRVLSKERIWKSQAVVFFLRDYSGSMYGEPTEALVAQHLMIYSWLLVQYEKRVIPRFLVHDTECREVSPRGYFGFMAGGGTHIASGYQKINEVVENEGLADEYDIFVFQGSDGDDWDRRGENAIPELKNILSYVSRMGVTLFKRPFYAARDMNTTFEEYIEASGVLDMLDVFRMHTMQSDGVTEEMNIEAIKALIAQD